MSFYNDLHAGLIPGTDDAHDAALLEVVAEVDRPKHKDDGGGVQPWSKGDFYPWVWTCVENIKEGRGKMYYIHPDGHQSAIVRYGNGHGQSFREAHRLLDDIMGAIIDV
jgi:hypothetical protein